MFQNIPNSQNSQNSPNRPNTAPFQAYTTDARHRKVADGLSPRYFMGLCAEFVAHPSGPISSNQLELRPSGSFFTPQAAAAAEIDKFVINKLLTAQAVFSDKFSHWYKKFNIELTSQGIAAAADKFMVVKNFISGENGLDSSRPLSEQKDTLIKKQQELSQEIRTTQNQLLRFYSENESLGALLNEMPQLALFTDGKMPWVRPSDITATATGFEISYGEVTYSQYVGTREYAVSGYDENCVGTQFATLGLTFVVNKSGEKSLLYTLRSELNEAFPNTYNLIGGAGVVPKEGSYKPFEHIQREISQEAGIPSKDLNSLAQNCLGIVRETYFSYQQPVYVFNITEGKNFSPISRDGETFYHFANKKPAAREVDLKMIPWNATSVKNLLTGVPMSEGQGDPCPRLWVPAGVMAVLQAGKLEFGQNWYDETLAAVNLSLNQLGKELGKI